MSKRPTKSELAMERAIEVLLEGSFVPDGETAGAIVRAGSSASPVYGAGGGQLSKVGGRRRFALPGTEWKATVGKLSTSFYRVVDGATHDLNVLPTNNEERLARAVASAAEQKFGMV